MQAFIDFLVNNYLWFLVISLILIFALIGYLVDVSEKKEKNVSQSENKEENISVNMNQEESIETNEVNIEPNIQIEESNNVQSIDEPSNDDLETL